jgi:GDP-L-fucose synthase
MILITGGTGMVGKNLQTSFLKYNLSGIFMGRDGGRYDLTDYSKTKQLFNDTEPNIVIHASANVGGIGYNKSNPASLIRENLIMGINVLDACFEFGVEYIYITSTCCSYPKFCPVPFREDDLWNGYPEETNSGYGISKKTIIKMSQDYRQQYGLKTTCFILANLYGYYDNFNLQSSHVVPALIRKFIHAKENSLPTVECWGSGAASRDLFYCGDLADVMTEAVKNRFDYFEPINLGTGKDITIKDLAYMIKQLTAYDGGIVFTGEVSDGQPVRRLDTTRAKNLLNFQAPTSLEEGLTKTINWYQDNKHSIR